MKELTKETVKILGIHFSHDTNIQNEQNYLKMLLRIEQVLKLWRMGSLFLDGK